MRDKDAHLMMEGLYKEAPDVDDQGRVKSMYGKPNAMYGQPATAAEPVLGPAERGEANLIPYSILGQLIQELEDMWALGGKDAAQATTQSGQSIQQVVGDIVNMAVVRAQNYSRGEDDDTAGPIISYKN